jgi:hypothetical protein
MSKVDGYRRRLQGLDKADWDAFLREASGLPGPRGNLELARAVAAEGDEDRFRRYAAIDPQQAPTNDPGEFLAFCGILGLGRLLAEGRDDLLPWLRRAAADPRWRLREAVAQGLQQLGARDMDALLSIAQWWQRGTLWEQRAAVAAICEPSQLTAPRYARAALQLLDDVTTSLTAVSARRDEGFKALRKALGYGWSVAIVALPAAGKPLFARWLDSEDRDVRWIVKQNLRKKRLERLDHDWVASSLARLQ